MKKPYPNHGCHTRKTLFKLVLSGLALASCALLAPSARAVDIRMVGQPVRDTVSVNSSTRVVIPTAFTVTTNGLTTFDGTGTNWVCAPVSLSATCPASPSGLSFTITDWNTNIITSFTPVIPTNQGSITVTNLLWVNTTNVPSGTYGFSLNASGPGTGTLLLSVQSAYIWSGVNATNGGSIAWTDSGNWVGGNVPVSGGEVVFNDGGGLVRDNTNYNVRISASTTLGSLRHAITSVSTMRHNFQLDSGVTLSITNSDGYNVGYRDRSDIYQNWFLTFTGPGAALVVSNPAASVNWFSYGVPSTNHMDQLGTFVANVYQFNVSDYRAYPNYTNMEANAYPNAAMPRNMPCGEIRFARTNIIKCGFTGDTEGWTNPAIRSYSLVLGRNVAGGGTTQRRNTMLGVTNYFALNSICFAGPGVAMDQTGGRLIFNTNFSAIYGTNNCVAVFRGTNGTDRVAMFAISDFAVPGAGNGSTKAIMDFTGGTMDALVDKLWIARDRTNNGDNGDYATGELQIGRGTFDVNDVILGFQGNGNNMGTREDYAKGTLRVGNGGLFRVNNAIDLGYTTADATNNASETDSAKSSFGKIFLTAGATLSAKAIRVGGVTKLSFDNTISLSGDSTLIVSNTVAGADKMLTGLAMSGGTVTLHLDGNKTTPYMYVTNTTTPSGANVLNVAQVNNFKTNHVVIFQYGPNAASFGANFTITMPPPYYNATAWDDTVNKQWGIDISTNPPKNLLWVGNINALWDTTNKNWLDLATGIATNFVNGDNVAFDETATSKSITLVNTLTTPLIPSRMTMTNTSTYTFTGSGQIQGSPALAKYGSGALAMDAITSISATINQGSLTSVNSGARIGSVTIAAGATMTFGGTITSGLVCAGTATFSGTMSGALTISSGGIVTNAIGGAISANSVALASGSRLVNAASLVPAGGANVNITVTTNSYLLNIGTINCSLLTVDNGGTLKDMGMSAGASIAVTTLTIGNGGTFIPGGDAIDTTRINSSYATTISGRVLMQSGSTNVFKVQPSAAGQNSTRLLAGLGSNPDGGLVDFGPSQSTPLFNGCYLQIVNLDGANAFTNGQVFSMFGESELLTFLNLSPTGSGTNCYPIMQPTRPKTGLTWDFSNLKYMDGSGNNGFIRVIGTATQSPVLAYTPTIYYNVMTASNLTTNGATIRTNITTNDVVVSDLSWPAENMGWRLERQDSTVLNGLRNGDTNWVHGNITASWTNTALLTNTFTTNQPGDAIFWRLVYP